MEDIAKEKEADGLGECHEPTCRAVGVVSRASHLVDSDLVDDEGSFVTSTLPGGDDR